MTRDATVLLDEAIRRFPRVVQACAKYEFDHIRAIWLHADGCIPAIVAEYRILTTTRQKQHV